MKLEKRLEKVPNEIAEAIMFYESELSNQALRECEEAKGTECYVDVLLDKYREKFRR